MAQPAPNLPAASFEELPLREQLARLGITSTFEKQQRMDKARYHERKQEQHRTVSSRDRQEAS
jgi:hypothetical protein